MSILSWENRRLLLADGTEIFAQHGRWGEPGDGDKPTLVLLHEALGHIDMWKGFPALLAEATGLDLFVYERRGYGRSSPMVLPRDDDYLEQEGRDWLIQVLDAAGLNNVILVGHSDGGSIALVGAACLPDRVVGLITEAAHIRVDDLTRAGITDAVGVYHSSNLPERLARYHGERTDQIFRAWYETWQRRSFQMMDLTEYLKDIRCPALIMQGCDDEYGESAQVKDIVAGIGEHAVSLFIPDCGHIPHLQAPAATLQAMQKFIETLDYSSS